MSPNVTASRSFSAIETLRVRIVLSAFAFFFFSFAAAQSISAATLTVNSLNDAIAADGQCTLREAIINVNADNQSGSVDCAAGAGADSINISVAGTINLLTALPDLMTDMTVSGLGATITIIKRSAAAATEFRIFTKTGGNSQISAMTVRDGISRGIDGATGGSALGGGINNGGGALTLTNVVITNNQAIGGSGSGGAGGDCGGGGIYNVAALTISNSTISNNTATGGTGSTTGGVAFGGGITNESEVAIAVMIVNTVVSGNTATGGTGTTNGGIAVGGGVIGISAAALTINNSQIFNNSVVGGTGSATGSGGGIHVNNSGVSLSLNSSIVSGNSATDGIGGGFGGGIRNNGAATITNSTISGNTGITGGAINNTRALNLLRSTVSGNTAAAGSGGFTSGGINTRGTAGVLNVTNSTISGNFANDGSGNNGGGIWNQATATLINTTIANNSAAGPNSASGVNRFGGTINVKNTIIAANAGNAATPDVFSTANAGSFVSQGYNLIGNVGAVTAFTQTGDQTGTAAAPLDPMIAPLATNGGATQTHRLLAGSLAIDKGASATDPITNTAVTTDQRGSQRPVDTPVSNAADGNGSDIGAFEISTPTAANVSVSGRVLVGSRGLMNARVTLTDQNGAERSARTTVFGNYRFDEVEAGQTYIVAVHSKRYQFVPQVITVSENLSELYFYNIDQ